MDPLTSETHRAPRLLVALLGVVVFAVAALAIPSRATYGAQTSGDEPQYLLTAQSIADDGDLDIGNQLDRGTFRAYHEVDLNPQTYDLDETGRRVSPHDPLLPVIVSPAMALGGWQLVKVALSAIAALTAMTTCWVLCCRLRIAPLTSALVVGAAFVSMPLASFGSQVYPEMTAALVVVTMVGALLAPEIRRRHLGVVALGVVALPWLSVKYTPTAAAIGLIAVVLLAQRRRYRELAALAVWAVVMGAVYLWVHQLIYGGWTAYAAGDHFVERGEFAVVGGDPNYVGRTRRVVGLLVDRRYGLVGWSPLWVLLPAAVAWLAASATRSRWLRAAVLVPLASGWATATWVALSMHSWWSPGRQIVVVAPLAVIAIAVLVDRFSWLRWPTALFGVVGGVNWLWLAWETANGERTLVVDFFETDAAPYRLVAPLLAQGWARTDTADLIRSVWVVGFAAMIVATVAIARSAADRRRWLAAAVVLSVAVGVVGVLEADDGELTRPAEIYRPDD